MEPKYPQILANYKVIPDGTDIAFEPYIDTQPEPGTLRLYTNDGTYTDYKFDTGMVIATSSNNAEPTYNLNTCTELSHRRFYYRSNITVPNGITFDSVTNCSYTFSNAKNIVLPSTVTFKNLTTATYMFTAADNITFQGPVTFSAVTNAERMFQSAQNIVIPEGATFEKVTNAVAMFRMAKNITVPESATFGAVTDAKYIFYSSSGVNIPKNLNLEKATTIQEIFRQVTTPPVVIPRHMRCDLLTNCRYMLYYSTFDGYLPFSFLKTTDTNAMIEGSSPSSACPDKIVRIPNGVFGVVTTAFGSMFWNIANWVGVDMPLATFAKMTSGGTTSGTTNKKFRMPNVTWESLTTALNKNTYPNYYIMPMPNLNLKSLNTGDGMFSKDGMDLVTLKAIADTIKDHTATGGTHNITLGIDVALQGSEEVAALLTVIRGKGWTVTEQYNTPTEWIYD